MGFDVSCHTVNQSVKINRSKQCQNGLKLEYANMVCYAMAIKWLRLVL